jgi:starch-binding outer membrane protein, SusD/RagB family
MRIHSKLIVLLFFSLIAGLGMLSCKKMVTVPQPITNITTAQVFTTNAQATAAMAGVYTYMINTSALTFGNGYASILGGLSADELLYNGTTDAHMVGLGTNQLLQNNSYTTSVWTTAYKVIYNANAVIEGIEAAVSDALTDSVRKVLTGEAKFVRALSYFYLTNLFGDVPLALTVDFNKTRYMTRTPVNDVYRQIIQDLKEAQSLLAANYPVPATGPVERVIPNKWTATAMLARVYLYRKDYANAAAEATAVISNVSMYSLENNPNNVFLPTSKEAIWQLKQGTNHTLYKNATQEGYNFLPSPLRTGAARYWLTASLLNAFEPGDRRRKDWVDSTNFGGAGYNYFPYKYKSGAHNSVANVSPTEYYTVLRLAEMYLIRAEAAAHGANGGVNAAITDLNVIRTRAVLPALPTSLTAEQAIAAVAHERQTELFAEWGHRWLDLKRTGRAHDVLSIIPNKQPWAGDYQLLYPIPPVEITVNPRLVQNIGYN